MDRQQREELVSGFGDHIQFDRPMAQYTTFRVGGPVEAVVGVHDLEELRRLVMHLYGNRVPYLVLGWGSNLLVKDEGLEGVAILLMGALAKVEEINFEDRTLLTGAGLSVSALLKTCRDKGLGGLEFLAGIPGALGGVVAMNAGAFGEEIGSRIREIQLLTPEGELIVKDPSRLPYTYRHLEMGKGNVIVRVRLHFHLETKETVAARIRDYLERRRKTQPLEYPSAGSIFKNPPNAYAGKLIEEAGLKGEKIGGAVISRKHANFIVNTGGATAKDILALMDLARNKVKERTGILLEPEVNVVGK